MRTGRKTVGIAILAAAAVVWVTHVVSSALWVGNLDLTRLFGNQLTKAEIAEMLGRRAPFAAAPSAGRSILFTIDHGLQATIEQVLRRGKVAYGAFVALDARTGRVLAMVSHGMDDENLSLRATFPAASIFKIVTAAAAIEGGILQHDSLIPVLGSFHTLYKRNVFSGGLTPETSPRFARLIRFEDALAKSVNSVFGKVGIFGVGPERLRDVAARFQFNHPLPFELPTDPSTASVPDEKFGLAEAASGFTRLTTLSPLHGALIAAVVANEGVMMEPSIVSQITDVDGNVEYAFEPKTLAQVVDKGTAEQLAIMMNRTIVAGTSRRAFRRTNRSLADVYVGGKTGTLDGTDPRGRYDWFVGFGTSERSSLAVAALSIHGAKYGIKASQVARAAFESYFGTRIAKR